VFTVRGHGVHSAFEDHVRFLTSRDDTQTAVNGRPRRSTDIVHLHTVGPYSLLFLLFGAYRKVATAHITVGSLVESIVGARQLRWIIQRYLRSFYNRLDLLIAVSEQTAVELRQAGVTKPVVVLPNLIRCQEVHAARNRRTQVRRRLGLGDSEVLVLSVGQVQPRKGLVEFLKCARNMPQVRFLWAGAAIFGAASADKSNLERSLRTASSNVLYTGQVSRHQIFEYLAAADIYVSLSRQETFGLAVLEAAAASCPLVLSDIPVFRATYGGAAQYVGVDGPVPIIAKLAEDGELRRNWGRQARKVAIRHDWGSVGESLISVYREVTERDGEAAPFSR
jgi:1,2-diacylglycerol-3-alpha-glucose alpha-1,2-galactosyltransferase